MNTDAGKALYGDNYVGIETLVSQHLDGAGRKDCDHWHDDAGIMTHHLGFTLRMELALQAVDASVTIPYWESTVDAAELGSAWRDYKVFAADWFGNSGDKLGMLHTMKEGRWAKLPVMENAWNFDYKITNAYGQLRAPWNLNSAPFVARDNSVVKMSYMGGDLPSCDVVKSCFDSDSLADMNVCLNGATHGPIHVLVGGQWDVDLGEAGEKLIGPAHLLLFKDLWRRGFARCPSSLEDVAALEAAGDVACSCSADLVEAVGGAYEVLSERSGILHWLASSSQGRIAYDATTERFFMPGKTKDEEEAMWKDLLTKLCSPGKVGEMYTSSAPYDPLFWVLHTTSERLLQYRRLRAVSSAKFPTAMAFDETWGYTHMDADSDLGVVCDWSDVGDGDAASLMSLPTCLKATCPGHGSDDVIPFDLSAASDRLSSATTNAEFYAWLAPTNDHVPYVYDTFKYEHCEATGVLIGAEVDDDGSSPSAPPPTRA